MNQMIEENGIAIFDNFFDEYQCDKSIELMDTSFGLGFGKSRREDPVYPTDAHEKNDTAFFASTNDFNLIHNSYVASTFNEQFWKDGGAYYQYTSKFSIIKKSDPHKIYSIKYQRTQVGEGYHTWHFETDNRMNSNRILTFILYLNTIEEGGETEFLYYPKRVKPQAGRLVLFPGSFMHTHRGNPPISGKKDIITGWVEY